MAGSFCFILNNAEYLNATASAMWTLLDSSMRNPIPNQQCRPGIPRLPQHHHLLRLQIPVEVVCPRTLGRLQGS